MQFGLLRSVWGHGWVVGSLYFECQVARKEEKGVCVVGCDTVVLAMQLFARVAVPFVVKKKDLGSGAAFGW